MSRIKDVIRNISKMFEKCVAVPGTQVGLSMCENMIYYEYFGFYLNQICSLVMVGINVINMVERQLRKWLGASQKLTTYNFECKF